MVMDTAANEFDNILIEDGGTDGSGANAGDDICLEKETSNIVTVGANSQEKSNIMPNEVDKTAGSPINTGPGPVKGNPLPAFAANCAKALTTMFCSFDCCSFKLHKYKYVS